MATAIGKLCFVADSTGGGFTLLLLCLLCFFTHLLDLLLVHFKLLVQFFEHGLLLLLLLFLPVHDSQDNLALLLGEMAEVGHLWGRHGLWGVPRLLGRLLLRVM